MYFRAALVCTCLLGLLPRGWAQHRGKAVQEQHNPSNKGHSPAYDLGYKEGVKDRSDNLEPRPEKYRAKNDADRRAYELGYHTGYCSIENGSGYFNGRYTNDAHPALQNGYYGYNAPNPACTPRGRRLRTTGPIETSPLMWLLPTKSSVNRRTPREDAERKND